MKVNEALQDDILAYSEGINGFRISSVCIWLFPVENNKTIFLLKNLFAPY